MRKNLFKRILFTIFILLNAKGFLAQDLVKKVENQIQNIIKNQPDYPSGVVVITKHDSILMQKGFGLSDIENQISFNPNTSLLNTASISKIITATAIFQLIEKGKIKLNVPLELYLKDLEIDNPFHSKITIQQLLTHTSGLSDMSIGLSSKSKEDVPLIKDFLKNYLPPIVWEPGKYYNYSNFAFVLLAIVIENVSNLTYQDYVKKYIFDPLQMNSSQIGEDYKNPLQMKYYKWKWYNDDSGIYLDKKSLDYSNLIGAGAFITTGSDMCNFIQAYLNNGVWKNTRILDSISIKEAWTEKFGYDNRIPHKMGLGWHIKTQNDVKQVYHHGDGSGVETALMLLPEKNIGVFMSFNNDAENVKYQIMDSITQYFYPDFLDKKNDFVKTDSNQSKSGVYRYMNLSQHTFEKIVYLFGVKTFKVEEQDSEISIESSIYKAIDSEIYEHEKQHSWAKFLENENNKISHLTFGYSTYKKLKWWEYPIVHQIALVLGALFFIITLFILLIRIVTKRKKASKRFVLIIINGLLIPIAFISMMLAKESLSIDYGVSVFFYIVFSLPLVALTLYPFSIYTFFRLNKQKLSISTKILGAIGLLLLSSQLLISYYYNIIGYYFG